MSVSRPLNLEEYSFFNIKGKLILYTISYRKTTGLYKSSINLAKKTLCQLIFCEFLIDRLGQTWSWL